MKQTIIFILTLLNVFLGISIHAQNGLDSLDYIISSDKTASEKIDAALILAGELEYSDYKSAKTAADWSLRESKSIDYRSGIYQSYYALASMHYESAQKELM